MKKLFAVAMVATYVMSLSAPCFSLTLSDFKPSNIEARKKSDPEFAKQMKEAEARMQASSERTQKSGNKTLSDINKEFREAARSKK